MNESSLTAIEVRDIMAMLPHRYPFQLLDRVLSWQSEPVLKLTAIKNVTINEPFFQGHFPGNPIMPGVLIIEALAQASGVLAFVSQSAQENPKGLYYLVKIDNARFKRTVVPGDQLVLEVIQKRMVRGMGLYECEALVDGRQVASAEILCAGRSDA
ncbi:MAG TPA: 3-hydroxyacyl-ACP dehydratase FabZ [Xanthomonadales bacterium]|nr:3-hydroxyacyl-ACP dehydratase FabZ [Xanthomonadales bacterium]